MEEIRTGAGKGSAGKAESGIGRKWRCVSYKRCLFRPEAKNQQKLDIVISAVRLDGALRECFTNCVNSVTLNDRHKNGNTRRI